MHFLEKCLNGLISDFNFRKLFLPDMSCWIVILVGCLLLQSTQITNLTLLFTVTAKALQYLQILGIIHRDIKPANILVCSLHVSFIYVSDS
jgi:serine/threonine protein kinase